MNGMVFFFFCLFCGVCSLCLFSFICITVSFLGSVI